MTRALVIVDVQVDFCPGGALAVPDGDKVVPIINELRKKFHVVALTKDWHPENHCSFKEFGGMWPPHCVTATPGASLHPDIVTKDGDIIIYKGIYHDADCYSAFADDEKRSTGLSKLLRVRHVDELYVCGLALDYCVKATVMDATGNGCRPFLVIDACAAVNASPGDDQEAITAMKAAGATVVTSDQI